MIALHPLPTVCLDCPVCHAALRAEGWLVPGMRCLAELACPQCGRQFYGDLPAGHGLMYPMLLEKGTGTVYNVNDVAWFEDWLRASYARRTETPVRFTAEERRPLRNPVLLNCLDGLYGHSLLKLLNAQHYIDRHPEYDLVVLVPAFLRWMVPGGVAAIWTVELPLRRGTEWNGWLAGEIHRRIDPLGHCQLSIAPGQPQTQDYDIERFTRVAPFALPTWVGTRAQPKITFIWRGDRVWGGAHRVRVPARIRVRLERQAQRHRVLRLTAVLRRAFPGLDFAIAGIGTPKGFPAWIHDLRRVEITEKVERQWCERYAQSHVVVGVHGSGMLLPSAHAGATVELVPADRWGNLAQDILPNARDPKEALIRYRFLPIQSSPDTVAETTATLLRDLPAMLFPQQRLWPEPSPDDLCRFWKTYPDGTQ